MGYTIMIQQANNININENMYLGANLQSSTTDIMSFQYESAKSSQSRVKISCKYKTNMNMLSEGDSLNLIKNTLNMRKETTDEVPDIGETHAHVAE